MNVVVDVSHQCKACFSFTDCSVTSGFSLSYADSSFYFYFFPKKVELSLLIF